MNKIEEQKLANGITLTIYDQSRHVAADRWLVKIRAEITLPIQEGFVLLPEEDDYELRDAVLAEMGGVVTLSSCRERNFIDAAAKERTLGELVEQASAAMLSYLTRPEFPAKLFASRYAELREKCLLDRHYRQQQAVEDDDEGPADFSACFRDQ